MALVVPVDQERISPRSSSSTIHSTSAMVRKRGLDASTVEVSGTRTAPRSMRASSAATASGWKSASRATTAHSGAPSSSKRVRARPRSASSSA